MMMIGGGVATPPGTAKSAAAIDSEMVQVDGIGSGSVSGSASGSGSPATGATTTHITNSNNAGGNNNNNNNNGDVANNNNNNNNNNNEGHAVVNCASGPAAATDKFCCHDDDAPVSTGVTRPWEPPSPTFSQTRSHLFQVHPPHHHQHPAAHHHQQMTVPPVSLIDGQFASTSIPFVFCLLQYGSLFFFLHKILRTTLLYTVGKHVTQLTHDIHHLNIVSSILTKSKIFACDSMPSQLRKQCAFNEIVRF